MASIWTGAIAFGLVNIPVKVETAVRSHDLSFRLLHQQGETDLCPVAYERTCKRDGEHVPWEEIVKGYEYAKDRFVILTEEDFESAALATSKTFEIQDFAPEDQIDPRYFEKPYYLVPQRGGEKGYALLREAMRRSGTLGIGTITMRKKQYLAAVKPIGDALVLDLMRFADEIVSSDEYDFPSTEGLKPQELKMAEQLVQSLTEDFDPAKYHDEYTENLEKIIAGKREGGSVRLEEAKEPEMTGVIDLMERLEASLAASKPGSRGRNSEKSTEKSRAKQKSAPSSKRKSRSATAKRKSA
jgi:DNA end-binding protein Ku